MTEWPEYFHVIPPRNKTNTADYSDKSRVQVPDDLEIGFKPQEQKRIVTEDGECK